MALQPLVRSSWDLVAGVFCSLCTISFILLRHTLKQMETVCWEAKHPFHFQITRVEAMPPS